MRPEVELMTDATLDAAVVDDLFGIQPIAPTSRFQNADVGFWMGNNGMSSSLLPSSR
jgi:hypothetical protein